MRAIKVTYRAVFHQPIGALNPMGMKLSGPIAVEIFGSGERWQARELTSGAVFVRLGRFGSAMHAKSEVPTSFERQSEPWQIWGRPPNENQERMLTAAEVVIDAHGKVFFKQAEDYTHIIHAQTIPPGARIPPAACGAQVNAKCFISTKANVEPSCKACAEVWRREYKGK
jgi:hypothetical protein